MLLDRPAEITSSLNEQLEAHLECYGRSNSTLYESALYSVQSKGHRWRPILFFTIYEQLAGQYRDPQAVGVACAIEFVHTASLILDDLMDKAALRRAQPTCHVHFGQPRAILTAMWLCDVAESLIEEAVRRDLALALNRELRTVKNEMMKGQMEDLNAEPLSEDQIIEKCRLKSGALYGFSASAPAILAERCELCEPLKRFGNLLGVAYQVADDIYDCTGTTAMLGKDVNKDEGKPTLPRVFGVAGAQRFKELWKGKAVSALEPIPIAKEPVIELVEKICA